MRYNARMKKEFFSHLEKILYSADNKRKFAEFRDFYDDFQCGAFEFDFEQKTILQDFLPQNLRIKAPMKVRRVRQISSNEALAKMLHSLAHIEFCAIHLALDSAYRFRGLKLSFYKDWVEVADDEIKHFQLIEQALNEIGFAYTDFEAHDNLQAALNATNHSLKYRMGVVHRGLEARGLDANPFVVKKLQNSTHPLKPFLEEILAVILRDEITHVRKGDAWWRFAKDDNDDFITLCKEFERFSLAGKVLNKEARRKAGFDESEFAELEAFYAQRGK